MYASDGQRTPGGKMLLAILIGAALAIPIFMTWWLVYDRQSQSEQARTSITEGWGGPQVMSGPVLVIPYKQTISETTETNGKPVVRTRTVDKELALDPEAIELASTVKPELRTRSIYQAVVYDASAKGSARYAFPADLARYGVDPAALELGRAELRFGLTDPRGLGANPSVKLNGQPVRLQPGTGGGQGSGFFAFVDASALRGKSLVVEFDYELRGNSSVALEPRGGDIHWTVASSWPHPSFAGGFLPGKRDIRGDGFNAEYRIGNLALGRTLVSTADKGGTSLVAQAPSAAIIAMAAATPENLAKAMTCS